MLRNISAFRAGAILYRNIQYSATNRMREIVVTKSGGQTVIEGKIIPSQREPYLIKPDKNIVQNACPLCRLNLNIKHTDVLILRQFIDSDGVPLPRKAIGICVKQYRLILGLIAMAQEAGILGNFRTWEGYTDVSKREGYKAFNTYFDEKTIRLTRPINKNPRYLATPTPRQRFIDKLSENL